MNARSGVPHHLECSVAAVVLAAGSAAWISCASPSTDAQLAAALDAARSASHDTTQAPRAVHLLEEFIGQHARDKSAPEAIKQLAILRQQLGDMQGAVADYQRILSEYPASDVADDAQFMVAFISEEHLRDFDAARRAYQAVIDNYPNSDLAENARQLLPHVGEPPDAWVRFQDGAADSPR